MKKFVISGVAVLFLIGCANTNINVNKSVNQNMKIIKIDNKLMNKYHVTTSDLINFGKYYIFFTPGPNGTEIVFLDKNYNFVKKFTTPYLLETKKIDVYNGDIYILGVDENDYYPVLLVVDESGKLKKKYIIHKKYALPKDLYFEKNNNYVLVDVFKNGKSYIEIYKNGKLLKKIELNHSINGNFVFKDGKDLFVIGTIKNTTQDAFIINVTKGWIRFFDLGMDENFDKYQIKNGEIILELHSTDEMGADSYYEIIIDKNGKILKNKCKVKFNPLPLRFRT